MKSVFGPASSLELLAVVPEADDHRTGVQLAQGLEQHVDALVVEELPEVDDGRAVAREKLGEAFGVAVVGQTLARIPGVRRVAARFLEQPGERLVARTRPPFVDVDAGRHLVHPIDVTDDVFEHLADVRGADEDGLRPFERLPPPGRELRIAAHRVLELRAVSLDAEARTRRCTHRTAEEHVIREDEVGRQQLADRGRIPLDPVVELGARALLDELHLVPLVAVEHEDGQETADVRPHELRAAEVVALGVRLLAQAR